jgi:mono/diheme cytochrome c family protein
VNVTVNLAGKQGTFYKTVFVYGTNGQKIDLNLKVNMPENPEMSRLRNQQLAMADHQSVFKGDCARCHVDPAKGLMGAPLYAKACGICHEAYPRDSKVTNLHAMSHPTNLDFWKQIIANGKQNTMMPGFSSAAGGPLTEGQIDSLVVYCYENFTTVATPGKLPGQITPTEPPPSPATALPPPVPSLYPARSPGVPLPPPLPSPIKN